jgi:hypothetical protein
MQRGVTCLPVDRHYDAKASGCRATEKKFTVDFFFVVSETLPKGEVRAKNPATAIVFWTLAVFFCLWDRL